MLILATIVALFLFATVIRGAPFVPSFDRTVARMLESADVKPGMKVADLGSGDGRIVIAFAKAGAEAHGYEINPLLVWWARRKIRLLGLSGKAFVHWQSFWKENLGRFDIVTVYGSPHIMKGLERKLRNELKPGAKVLSNGFTFPRWQDQGKNGAVYLYIQA